MITHCFITSYHVAILLLYSLSYDSYCTYSSHIYPILHLTVFSFILFFPQLIWHVFFQHTYLWSFLHSWLAPCFYHFFLYIFSAFFHTITHTHCLHSFFPFHIPHFFLILTFSFHSVHPNHTCHLMFPTLAHSYIIYHTFYTLLYYIPRTYSSCCNRLVFCFLFLLYYIFYYLSIMHFCSQYSYAFYLRQLWPT